MTGSLLSPGDLKGFSVRTLIDFWADVAPDREFLVDPDKGTTLTYGALRDSASAVAGLITSQDVEPGGKVAYAMANGVESALVILGSLYGGFVATAINLSAGTDTTAYVLDHSGSQILFAQPQTERFISGALANLANRPRIATLPDLPQPVATAAATAQPEPGSDGL